jgi:hypothetical protein
VSEAKMAAAVDRTSSARLPKEISACSNMSNQVKRQNMRLARAHMDNCRR